MKYLLLILSLFTLINANAQSGNESTSLIGTQYPEFNFTTTNGEVISSATTKGKVVLLSFWFKDCSPCRTEMEWLNELYDSLSTNTNFQFISLAREPLSVLPGYIEFFQLKYPVVSLVDYMKYILTGGGFPTNIILDKNGKVAYYKNGGNRDRAKARKEILEGLLPEIKALL